VPVYAWGRIERLNLVAWKQGWSTKANNKITVDFYIVWGVPEPISVNYQIQLYIDGRDLFPDGYYNGANQVFYPSQSYGQYGYTSFHEFDIPWNVLWGSHSAYFVFSITSMGVPNFFQDRMTSRTIYFNI
jgi:hypothetical protein